MEVKNKNFLCISGYVQIPTSGCNILETDFVYVKDRHASSQAFKYSSHTLLTIHKTANVIMIITNLAYFLSLLWSLIPLTLNLRYF